MLASTLQAASAYQHCETKVENQVNDECVSSLQLEADYMSKAIEPLQPEDDTAGSNDLRAMRQLW